MVFVLMRSGFTDGLIGSDSYWCTMHAVVLSVREQVMANLILDGVTNAEQDRINARFKPPGSFMMIAINFWILLFHVVFLAGGWALYGEESEIARALNFMITFPEVCSHVRRRVRGRRRGDSLLGFMSNSQEIQERRLEIDKRHDHTQIGDLCWRR